MSRHFGIDGQWLWNHAMKFARWQHPAVGHSVVFDWPDTAYS